MGKRCPGCGVLKPADAYPKNRKSGDGLAFYCKPCHSLSNRSSVRRRGGSRHYHLVQRYGLSADEVADMIAAQGGFCASCEERLATQVDDDHKTGRVRGILCDGCNGGIALFDEDIDLLKRAAAYLNGQLDL